MPLEARTNTGEQDAQIRELTLSAVVVLAVKVVAGVEPPDQPAIGRLQRAIVVLERI